MVLLALICILGAIICFVIEVARTRFSLIALGLLFLSLFFAFNFLPTVNL